MVSVLIAGFGRFPGAPFNPTTALARRLSARRRPAFAGIERCAHVFRTSYAAVEDELPRLIADRRPDIVLLLGLAARTPWMRVETRAQNRTTLFFPDVDRVLPKQPAIRAGSRDLPGRAPFVRLVAAARAARVPARLSWDAGRYLCNYAYFRAIEETATKDRPPLVTFVHVPGLPRGQRKCRTRRLTAADLLRGSEAILIALVAAARRQR